MFNSTKYQTHLPCKLCCVWGLNLLATFFKFVMCLKKKNDMKTML